MAVEIRDQRQSHRFHSMKLLSEHGGGKSGDMHLNVVPLVDMMMVLVIFLVMNFNASGVVFVSDDMDMPMALHGSQVTNLPVVSVSYNQSPSPGEPRVGLWFGGEFVTDLSLIDPEDPDRRIPELEELLVENRRKFEMIGGADRAAALEPDKDPTTTVNVQIDKNVDYSIVRRVLYTCELASYVRIRLAMGDGATSAHGDAAEGEE
jgi:biopolymer transport protein ExbD